MLRRLINFTSLAAICFVLGAGTMNSAGALAQETPKPSPTPKESKETKAAPPLKKSQEPTGEQVAELVVYAYGGSRQVMQQIQRNSVERGRITRTADEGRTEDVTYERRSVRADTSEKDKIRLDQKTPAQEYSIVYNGGRIFGVVNGTSFTPRQDAVAPFLSNRHHGIDALLRYKENGATVTYAGKDKQKNIDMWLLDLVDKEKRRTRYYISSQKWRVLWLEYEETPPGASKPVQYRRTFHDYRYAQGQLFAYRTVLYADGKQAEETNIINVTFGSKLDDALFKDSSETAATAQP